MAEFKFSCPLCNQHIQCDTGYAGMQINCPSCNQAIIVPHSAAAPPASAGRPAYEAPPPPPPPPGSAPALATRQSTTIPAGGKRFPGAPGAQPPPKSKSKALKTVLVITACIVVLAGLGAGAWFGLTKFKAHRSGSKPNPAAHVATPTAAAAVQGLSILTKIHSAYTNVTSMTSDNTITLFLSLSNITQADLTPNAPANARNGRNPRNTKTAARRPTGMPRTLQLSTDLSIKTAHTNWFYAAGDLTIKQDRNSQQVTYAIWSADNGMFIYQDSHQQGAPATYMQLPDATSMAAGDTTEQVRRVQQLFSDPAQLTKIVKDLGQTEDETVNGQACSTLTAKVFGQKIKIWVDKSTYLIVQSQITLGGAISDDDIDDAFSLFTDVVTNVPPAELNRAKAQLKLFAPVVTKISGTLTSTTRKFEKNPTLTGDDFKYPVPAGVRLTQMAGAVQANTANTANAAAALQARQRNTCISSLRQIDGAKNQWALEKGKKKGDAVTEADLAPYLPGGALPKCPAGGKYDLGKVGESPTCSIASHVLP
jgi:hypothetical protein